MAYPMTAAGLAPTDALFESASSITTTGLTMIAQVAAMPRTLVFARSWLQWCGGLGLTHTIIPTRSVGRYLAAHFEGRDPLEITAMVRGDARIFSFVARAEDAAPVAELDLPKTSRVICIYRNDEFLLPDSHTRLREGDEVIVIVHRDGIPRLEERWGRRNRAAAAAGATASAPRPRG